MEEGWPRSGPRLLGSRCSRHGTGHIAPTPRPRRASCSSRQSELLCDGRHHGSAYHAQRLNMESALDAGLMARCPRRVKAGTGEHVSSLARLRSWQDVLRQAHREVLRPGRDEICRLRPIDRSGAYRVRDFAFGSRSGFVVLSRISGDEATIGEERDDYCLCDPGLFQTELVPAFLLEADPALAVVDPSGTDDYPHGPRGLADRAGRDWRLYSMQVTSPQLAPDSCAWCSVPESSIGPNKSPASEPIARRGPGNCQAMIRHCLGRLA